MDSISSRYAIALLSVAREEKSVASYVDEASAIAASLKENKELLTYLKAYGLSKEDKKNIIDNIYKPYFKEYIINLMYILIDNNRGGYMLDVFNEFVRIGSLDLNKKMGTVYSTEKLNAKQMKALEAKISGLLKSDVTLKNEIDKDLLGGFKIQVDDYVLDDSLKNRLEKLKETVILKKGE